MTDLLAEPVSGEADPSPRSPAPKAEEDRWLVMLRSAGLGLALAGTIAIGWNHTHPRSEERRSCPAAGYVTDDGERLTRDTDRGCAWVDEDGKPVPVDEDGKPMAN